MLAIVARIATKHREAVLPKEERSKQEQQPAYRKTKRGSLAGHDDRLVGHGERLRLQIDRLKNDPHAKKSAPSAARRRAMGLASLRTA